KIQEAARMTRENQVELDRRLEKLGVEGGVTNPDLTVSLELLPSQRTGAQKGLASKYFDAYETFRAELAEKPGTTIYREKPTIETTSHLTLRWTRPET
ncbi:MAG: hypothetical protein R6U96_03780, partial [Promethearchaeia archaeon]